MEVLRGSIGHKECLNRLGLKLRIIIHLENDVYFFTIAMTSLILMFEDLDVSKGRIEINLVLQRVDLCALNISPRELLKFNHFFFLFILESL